MNSTDLANKLIPFSPDTDRLIFYGAAVFYSVTAMYTIMLKACRVVEKKNVAKQPFEKFSSVVVEPKGHEITTNRKFEVST